MTAYDGLIRIENNIYFDIYDTVGYKYNKRTKQYEPLFYVLWTPFNTVTIETFDGSVLPLRIKKKIIDLILEGNLN